jgi:hypothetical protein
MMMVAAAMMRWSSWSLILLSCSWRNISAMPKGLRTFLLL